MGLECTPADAPKAGCHCATCLLVYAFLPRAEPEDVMARIKLDLRRVFNSPSPDYLSQFRL